MSRSSDSGGVEPLAALAAVFAVCAGVSVYAVVLGGAFPDGGERSVAAQAVDRVHETASTAGVVDPARLVDAPAVAPRGYRLNATLAAGERRWHAGPAPPAVGDDAAVRRTSVRLAPGRVRPGRLRVVVWR